MIQQSTASLFFGFGIYTLLLILALQFRKGKTDIINQFDQSVCLMIPIVFIIFILTTIIDLMIQYNQVWNTSEFDVLYTRVFGKYWLGYWIQPILFLSSQLLWFQHVRKNVWIRLFIGIVLLISVEQIIIYLTSLHREYLPSTWSITLSDRILSWTVDFISFLVIGILFHFLRKKLLLLIPK